MLLFVDVLFRIVLEGFIIMRGIVRWEGWYVEDGSENIEFVILIIL